MEQDRLSDWNERTPRLRVSIVGHFRGSLDEGVRLTGKNLAENLRNTPIEIQTHDISSARTAANIHSFKPHIVHFVISPTVQGLMMTKALSFWANDAKTIISAIHPAIPDFKPLRLLRPDLLLAQSEDSERKLASLGFKTEFLPNGVDTVKFKPLGEEERIAQRTKLDIPVDAFVPLHLGPLRKGRNLGVFSALQKLDGVQCVVVGREREKVDSAVLRNLKDAGCTVLLRHFPDIQRIFNMADCYVFPTLDRRACVETPLSVLEAIACGIPTVTTRFGTLPRIVATMEGVFFADDAQEIIRTVQRLNVTRMRPSRTDVDKVSWMAITERLVSIYREIANRE